MKYKTAISVIGFLSILFSLSVVPAIFVSWLYHDGELFSLFEALISMLLIGFILWIPFREQQVNLSRKDGFLIVALFWILLGLLGALPFEFSLHMSIINSVFESISGLTTTGATVITGLDDLPPSILFYRQELQWLGGLGLVVLAVAVLPMLGIGGMSMYRAETPGPLKDNKLVPRISNTAKYLWIIYIGLTIACALAYWLAGMSGFDAISHSLSTVSTGGFSTHDASMSYFHSRTIEGIAIVFMLLAAINFTIHYLMISQRDITGFISDLESRTFLTITASAIALTSLYLFFIHYYNFQEAFEIGSFEVVSVITSTGFGLADFTLWPGFLPLFLICIAFVGGCGGSTAGGMKVMRVILISKIALREFKTLLHPKAIFTIKLSGHPVHEKTRQSVLGFFALYVVTFAVLVLMMVSTGLDPVSSFSVIATCINNLGPGLGEVATTFQSTTDTGKVISIFAMLTGRLEIFTILVIFSPYFWRT
jgi:trk system potassium uptake protein TrkH